MGRTKKEVAAQKTRVYTEGYAPPEQIIGRPETRSDLFALAGTLYHLTTGEAPEGFNTAAKIKENLSAANSPYPKNFHWFYDLIRVNLAEDKNDRYFSAAEIKADLERRQVSKDVPCPTCKAPNKVRDPYCAKCGKVMPGPTPPCNHCGKDNHMGSRFCIHCGNRLR
jgi:serine/threonine protein kinase